MLVCFILVLLLVKVYTYVKRNAVYILQKRRRLTLSNHKYYLKRIQEAIVSYFIYFIQNRFLNNAIKFIPRPVFQES